MRDLVFIAYIAAILAIAAKRPFLFVLAYAYIDIVQPQRLSYSILTQLPVSLIAFALALFGFLMDNKRDVRIAPRQILLILLLGYCALTTIYAAVPDEAPLKWGWVWKSLVFAIFLPLTLRTRLRIEALALTMVLSLCALVISGGMKTALGGGGYGTLVIQIDVNDGLFEGSIISAVAIASIPLVLWLARHGTIFPPDWRVKAFAALLCFACLLIPIGTQARTGLLCAAVLVIVTLRTTRHRFAYMAGLAAIGLVAIPFIPSSFTSRMETIKEYKSDESASTRLAVWGWTWDYVKANPLGGGFEVYQLNTIRYRLDDKGEPVDNEETLEVADSGRAFHSSYFEMLGEQGFPGLALWLLIHVGGLWRMEVLRKRYAESPRRDEAWISPLAVALQHSQIVYLVGSLFVGIAFQPFIYMLIGMQIGLDTYLTRRSRETGVLVPPPGATPGAAEPQRPRIR